MKDIAKYRVGQLVYTYQSPEKPIRIFECVDRANCYVYRMTLEDGTNSNYTDETSVFPYPLSEMPDQEFEWRKAKSKG
jgi:hypothetical protein